MSSLPPSSLLSLSLIPCPSRCFFAVLSPPSLHPRFFHYYRGWLGSLRFAASHDSPTVIVGPRLRIAHAPRFAATMAHACTHACTHSTPRNEMRSNPACNARPFCYTALSPWRYRHTRARGGNRETSRTARLKNRRKRIVTCLSADVHRRSAVRETYVPSDSLQR